MVLTRSSLPQRLECVRGAACRRGHTPPVREGAFGGGGGGGSCQRMHLEGGGYSCTAVVVAAWRRRRPPRLAGGVVMEGSGLGAG